MSTSRVQGVDTASPKDTTSVTIRATNKTAASSSQDEEYRRLAFVKQLLKSEEWEVVETVRVDDETHCFLAKVTAMTADMDWTSCLTLKIPLSRGPENRTANWHRIFLADIIGAELAASMSHIIVPTCSDGTVKVSTTLPFRFGAGSAAAFTFTLPERTVADQPNESQ
jgi:hypothetical protein